MFLHLDNWTWIREHQSLNDQSKTTLTRLWEHWKPKTQTGASCVFPKPVEVTQLKALAVPHVACAVWQLSHSLLVCVMAHCRPPTYTTLMTISKRKHLNSAKDTNSNYLICKQLPANMWLVHYLTPLWELGSYLENTPRQRDELCDY